MISMIYMSASRSPLVAVWACPTTATKKTKWLSQSVTGFASRRTATLPERLSICVSR
jgi:hypothetical protein